MRWALVLVVAVSLTACAPSRRRWRPRPVEGASSAAFVVVPLDAPLHTAPSTRADRLRLARRDSRSPWARRGFAVFRVTAERGGWAELESPGPLDPGHCVDGPRALRALRLRLFTPSASLVPVTVRDVSQSFADDTSITLARGVPVEPLRGTRLFRARLGALSAVVRLGVADTGTRYLPSPPPAARAVVGFVRAGAFERGAAILGQTGRVTREASPVATPFYSLVPRGPDERVVELREGCGALRVRVPADQLTDGADLLLGALTESSDPDAVVEPGAEVRWADGRVAGRTVERLALGRELASRGDRRCFDHPLRVFGDATDSVELCFDADDVLTPGAGLGARLARP